MLEVVKDDVQQKPAFDPTKKYTWSTDTEFVLKGSEFGLILNALRSIVSTPEAQSIFLANKAVDMIENTLGKAIEAGDVQEVVENKGSL
jgi:hypothetical protein